MDPISARWGILGVLPAELRCLVYERLDYGAAINLAKTNRAFHNEVQPSECTTASKHAFLSRAEGFTRHAMAPPGTASIFHTSYACYDCYRILPRDAFTDCTLAENRAVESCCESLPPDHRHRSQCPSTVVQGPLLPGGRWSRSHGGARVYVQQPNLCLFSTKDRRACLDCHLRRGGWWPGQPLLVGSIMYQFCVSCQSMRADGLCQQCFRCGACMAAQAASTAAAFSLRRSSFPLARRTSHDFVSDFDAVQADVDNAAFRNTCPHMYILHGSPHMLGKPADITQRPTVRRDDKYVEQMRRGLMMAIAMERASEADFLDLVFDPALDDEWPPPTGSALGDGRCCAPGMGEEGAWGRREISLEG